MAHQRLLLAPFGRKRVLAIINMPRCAIKNDAAQYAAKMRSLFVDAVQIAHDLFLVSRDPSHGHPYSSP
eukprot:4910414-Pyramimonas_sp.AAC.1